MFFFCRGIVKCEDFQFVTQMLKARPSSWKGNFLNNVGRVTLTKAIIATIPIYGLQFMWFPELICNEIDKHVRVLFGIKVMGKGFIWSIGSVSHPQKLKGALVSALQENTNVALLGKSIVISTIFVCRTNDVLFINCVFIFIGVYAYGKNK